MLIFRAGFSFTLRIDPVTRPSFPIPRGAATQRFFTPVRFRMRAATKVVSSTPFPFAVQLRCLRRRVQRAQGRHRDPLRFGLIMGARRFSSYAPALPFRAGDS